MVCFTRSVLAYGLSLKHGWGEGSVQLVEIPTFDETFDNIVAFWNPRNKPHLVRNYCSGIGCIGGLFRLYLLRWRIVWPRVQA